MTFVADVRRALAGGLLEGRPLRTLAIPTTTAEAISFDIDSTEIRSAWTAAREKADELAAWPVVVTGWSSAGIDGDTLFSRWLWYEGVGEPPSPVSFIERSRGLGPSDLLEGWPERRGERDFYKQRWPRLVEHHLARTRDRVGEAPDASDIVALDLGHDIYRLESLLLDWEEERLPTVEPGPGGYLTWFEPPGPCAVVFLPDRAPEAAPAYMAYWGATAPGLTERLVALMRQWHRRFGAELVAHWGTMLQFAVERPPISLDETMPLAWQQLRVAGSLGGSIREHARALLERPEWFLHEHP